jgi:hypothetical protein
MTKIQMESKTLNAKKSECEASSLLFNNTIHVIAGLS